MFIKIKYIAVLVVILYIQINIYGQNSRISATLDEERSFFRLLNILQDGSTSSLWDTDPLSSTWILKIDGKYITPSESGWFREALEDKKRFLLSYTNPQFEIHNELVITENEKNAILNVKILNLSNREVSIEPRLLLDTIKPDSSEVAFITDSNKHISGEYVFTGSMMPRWIRCASGRDKSSLTLLLKQTITTQPRAIILSNWQRIKQSNGDFGIISGRRFDLLPFSRNDSAMLINFSPKVVGIKSSYDIVLAFGLDGNVLPENFVLEASSAKTSTFSPEIPTASIPATKTVKLPNVPVNSSVNDEYLQVRLSTLNQRLNDINNVEKMIDKLLQSSPDVDEQAVLEVEILVDNQEQFQIEYESFQQRSK